MIQKKTWKEIKSYSGIIYLGNSINYCYNILKELFPNPSQYQGDPRNITILSVFSSMVEYFYYKLATSTYQYNASNTSNWDDMAIFISSFKPLGSHGYIEKVFYDLARYLDAYKLLLTNDGFAKHVSYHRFYHSQDEADGNNKNYYSETPQVSSGDEALDNLEYLSNASKDFSHGETSMDSEDTSTQTSTSWEEARKNMEMVYYKDLCRYIIKIPYLVYDYYALDDYPVTYSLKEFEETVKRSFDF